MDEDPLVEKNWREIAWFRVGGARVPVLAQIPRAHWREVLIPCSPALRHYAVYDHYLTTEQREHAKALVAELPSPASEAIRQEMPRVGFGHRIERPPVSRQLNLRLDTRDYESLATAARILGSKPTQVARMLINAGVRRLLAEYDVTMDRVPSES
jgi:hypothetical protein